MALLLALATFILVISGGYYFHEGRSLVKSIIHHPIPGSSPTEISFNSPQRLVNRRSSGQLNRELPLITHLFRIALENGHNIRGSIEVVSRYLEGNFGRELQIVNRQINNGMSISEALQDLTSRVGSEARPLLSALVASDRYGASIATVLERLGEESRYSQRQRIERATKKLSVQLLFPLAGCILPAFALLVLAPIIVSALGALISPLH